MNSAIFKTFFLSLCVIANMSFAYAQTASILPPAKTTFFDNSGNPLTSGKVYTYIPATTTPKTTWQDAAETIPNANPVILDAAGRALILGEGTYRQIVKDRNNNLIWDAVTSSTGSSGGGGSTATGDGDLVGTIKPWAGMTAPAQYAFTYGQEISRTTFATLFTAITSSQATFCNSGSPVLTGLGDTTNFWIGMSVEVSCVGAGFSTVVSKTSNSVTLAANANVTTNTTALFFPWGRGNGTTTFNLPDFRGVVPAGNNIMGGVASSNMTTTYFGATDPNSSGALGGSQSSTLATANLPPYTPVGTIVNGAITFPSGRNSSAADGSNAAMTTGSFGSNASFTTNIPPVQATSTFTGTAQGGTSVAFSRVQPTRSTNFIIKTTPDANSATANGVTDIQGMTGSITCGTGLTCTGNTITVNIGTGVTSLGGLTGVITCGSGISCAAGTVSIASATSIFQSRTEAASLDLSAYNGITTQGYAAGGDGGGAVFKKVGSTPFRDSFVTAISITGNGTSGCTNGSYLGKQPTGGTGTNITLNLTVAGNVVTAATIQDTGGNGYTAADVLTTTVTGCSTSVTFSVTTVSTPTGSFTDVAGNHWQITSDKGNFINVRQFGAKVDYAGVDATATDDFTAIQNAYNYAGDIHFPTIDGGGSAGARVIHPAGNSLVCGTGLVPLQIPTGVQVEGHNAWASTLKLCAAWNNAVNFINICDPDTHLACFAAHIKNLTLYSPFLQAANAGVSMIYSNNVQQANVLDRVAIYTGDRRCVTLETGYGGAAVVGMKDVTCTTGGTATNNGIHINYGTTIVTLKDIIVETSGPNTQNGINIEGGFVDLVGFHTEGISTGINVNIPGSNNNGMARLHNLSGGNACTDLVVRQGASSTNTLLVGQAVLNGCTNSVNNGGVGTAANILATVAY